MTAESSAPLRRIYLRLSVTSRCQLRCRYCRPARDCDSAPAARPHPATEPPLPTDAEEETFGGDLRRGHEPRVELEQTHAEPIRAEPDELLGLVELIHGEREIAKVRLTGGEPLLTSDPPGLVRRLRDRLPQAEIGLTTNGLLLTRYAESLRRAGLELLNVSLDTLDPVACRRLTRGARLDDILAGIRAARRAGFRRLKINSVLLRTINGPQLDRLVRFAAEIGCEIRFIELMPYGEGRRWYPAESLPAAEALDRLTRVLPHLGVEPVATGTARRHRFLVDGREQVVGFITAVSHPFCGRCDRMRLDSRGRLLSCLRQSTGCDLLTPWRAGRLDDARALVRRAIEAKGPPEATWPERAMVNIGG